MKNLRVINILLTRDAPNTHFTHTHASVPLNSGNARGALEGNARDALEEGNALEDNELEEGNALGVGNAMEERNALEERNAGFR